MKCHGMLTGLNAGARRHRRISAQPKLMSNQRHARWKPSTARTLMAGLHDTSSLSESIGLQRPQAIS